MNKTKRARKIDRSTVRFLAARHAPMGIDVSANFEAPKSSGETGAYMAQFYIDPKTKAVKHVDFVLRNRADGNPVSQRIPSMDKQRGLVRELRDIFLKLPAWEILRNREPDMRYIIDAEGKEIQSRATRQSAG